MRLWPVLVLAAPLLSQDLAPIGIVRGVLASCDSTHLIITDEDNHSFRFVTDGRTFIERDHQRIYCSKLTKGDRMEIVSDRSSEPGARYARLASVMTYENRARRRAVILPRVPLLYEDPTARFAPRGSLTFTGVVLRSETSGLVLRTKIDGQKWILLRKDTRFRGDGLLVDPSSLQASTRVFVRAGPSLDGEVEAYEVVWGDILSPDGPR